jgi:hypothetical protein
MVKVLKGSNRCNTTPADAPIDIGPITATLRLYLLTYDNANGDNMDLFVTAATPAESWSLWKQYFDGWTGVDDDDWLVVRVVPTLSATPMAHEWDPTLNIAKVHVRTGVVTLLK